MASRRSATGDSWGGSKAPIVNWLDGAIIILILWFTYAAFQAGFIREFATIVGAVLGVVLAGVFYDDVAEDVLLFVDNETLARILGFALVFGAVALAGQMVAMVLKPAADLLQLGIFDQLAGAAFGFVKAFVFIQVFLILFITYPKWGLDQTIEESVFGSITVRVVDEAPVIINMLPEEFEVDVSDFASRL